MAVSRGGWKREKDDVDGAVMINQSKDLIARVRFGAPLAWVRRSLGDHVTPFLLFPLIIT